MKEHNVTEIKGTCVTCRFRKEFFDEWDYVPAWCCKYPDKRELYQDNNIKSDEEFLKITYCNKWEESNAWKDFLGILPVILFALSGIGIWIISYLFCKYFI